MKHLMNNRGSILLTLAAVLAGIVLGVAVYGSWQDAEAILGGSGNVTQNWNPHNLAEGSTGIEATTEDRICVFCHTPHNALMDSSLINGPLWNHQLSTATYTTWSTGYANRPPYNDNVGWVNVLSIQLDQPDGSSRMCMGCHDGTIGIGNIVSGADIGMDLTNTCLLEPDGRLDKDNPNCKTVTDLSKKHIISIPMNLDLITNSAKSCPSAGSGTATTKLSYPWEGDAALANSVFLRPTATLYGPNPGVSSGFPNGKYKSGYSYGVQCSTCHDPHFWDPDDTDVGYKFLVTANQNDLCKACHDMCVP